MPLSDFKPDENTVARACVSLQRSASQILSNGGITAAVFYIEQAKSQLDISNDSEADVFNTLDTAEKTLLLTQASFNCLSAYLTYKLYKKQIPDGHASSGAELFQIASYVLTAASSIGGFANTEIIRKVSAGSVSFCGYLTQFAAHMKGESRRDGGFMPGAGQHEPPVYRQMEEGEHGRRYQPQ